jgi:hypothetical protein
MSRTSLFALMGLTLLAACASPTAPSTIQSGGHERVGQPRETCDPRLPPPPTDRPAAQEKQCVPIE